MTKTTSVRPSEGDVTRNDSQRWFLAQHSLAMLEQCCNYSKQCRNNVATLCFAKIASCNITFTPCKVILEIFACDSESCALLSRTQLKESER